MDRRMLAIGAAAIALWAVGCGNNDDASDRAAQGPDVEVEATVAPNSGTLEGGVPIEGTSRSDSAQKSGANTQAPRTDRSDAAQKCGSSLANACVAPKREMP